MNNGYEYYYLFGLDIPLEEYGLGRIKQPKLIDFLSKDISIDSFYLPFVMNDILISRSEDKEAVMSVKEQFGDLTFLLVNCYQSGKMEMISLLTKSLMVLYDAKNVEISKDFNIVVDDVEITNGNFKVLCDVVLEMLKIDKSKLKFDKLVKKELTEIEKEFEKRKQKYLQNNKDKSKKKGIGLIDICNSLSHCDGIQYEDILKLTIYQIKNSYEVISNKEMFNINVLHRISPKFDMSKDQYEHWTEKIKIDKSSLSRDD